MTPAPPALAPKKEELRDIIIHSGSTGQTFCPADCQRVISRQSFPHSSSSTGASVEPVRRHHRDTVPCRTLPVRRVR
ncbi:TPA: hypothetical protein I8P26_003317 [Salmonella enterica subsp. enterica serovar Napoli]|nr:hypothetical protein [Salmonella enterica subsp. enterica serovar Napoli]